MAKRSSNRNINTDIFCALKVAEKSRVPVLFLSNPGAGKSTTVSLFAKVRGYEVVLLRGNSTTAEEVMGYDVAPRDVSYDHKMAAISLRPSWFEEVVRNHEAGKKTLLFLDEITTANEFVQAALLHLIFERKVHTETLPEDTLIVSAGNYAQNLSNTMSLLPPVMNRFMIFNIVPCADDLNTFLNKYDGSLMNGKPNNYFEDLEKTMRILDDQELKDIDEEMYNKIGEHIENGIKGTARMLMTSGEKPVDMTVTDLQSIYSDTDNDAKLYGFISFRTLNYLRDVTMAYYLCFGKSGIESDIYKNSVDGLCGIGVKRDSKGEVKTTKIGKEFVDTMCQIVNDIEKMNNNRVREYEKFFTEILNPDKTEGGKKIKYTDPQLGALVNKLKELLNDQNLKSVSRPIDGAIISSLCDNIKETTSRISTKVSTSGKFLDSISADKFIANVVTWNMIVDIATSIVELVNSANMDYFEDTKNKVRGFTSDLRPVGFKIRSLRKMVLQEDPTLGATIPEVKSVELK